MKKKMGIGSKEKKWNMGEMKQRRLWKKEETEEGKQIIILT